MDKFRGTVTAADAVGAVARAADRCDWRCDRVPLADGGEGTLEALGGANRVTTVSGPLGDPVAADWRLARRTAVIEMAQASGLSLVGGSEGNDPLAASTHGTGELITAAVDAGATKILVGVGGSASTDGGLGALRAMHPHHRLRGVELIVACDVRTRFVDAASTFAPQKGATSAQVKLLTARLERLVDAYLNDAGIDVSDLEGGGAAGGLAGGLATVGAELVSGFDVVADELGLDELIEGADLVVTGEGFMDAESFEGKVVGGVHEMAGTIGVPVLAVVGRVFDGCDDHVPTVSLVERFGENRAMTETAELIDVVVGEELARRS
jgi:glycerate kinase